MNHFYFDGSVKERSTIRLRASMTQLAGVRGEPGACKFEHRKPLPQEAGDIPTLHPHTQGKAHPSRPGLIRGTPSSCIQVCLGRWQLHWNKKVASRVRLLSTQQIAPALGLFLPETLPRHRKRKPLLLAAGRECTSNSFAPGQIDPFDSKGSFLQKPALKEPPPESLHSVSLKPR